MLLMNFRMVYQKNGAVHQRITPDDLMWRLIKCVFTFLTPWVLKRIIANDKRFASKMRPLRWHGVEEEEEKQIIQYLNKIFIFRQRNRKNTHL